MKNPHIIVAKPRVCLCGVYDSIPVSCGDFIAHFNEMINSPLLSEDAKKPARRMLSLVEDCND